MKVKVLMCIVLSVVYSHAQDFSNYKPLRSKGPVPSDFTSSSFAKYQADIENIDQNSNRFERKSKDKFFLKSNYYNDIILRSGRVLFGDPVTIYINKVADYLLEPFGEIRQKVRFYTLKSPVVNAYSMDNGIILISTGLISKLENEVQLAFVICHELIHYIKKHAIQQYMEGEKIRKGKGEYNKLSWDDKLFAKLSYSREDELTADREAVSMILSKSDYDLSYVPGIFDVLDFHHTPFSDIKYDFSDLCPAGHQFDDEYFLEEITPPKPASGYDESKSTHPETTIRKKTIEELISGIDSSGTKKEWIISETEFMHVRNIARFENIHLYIINDQLGDAFYNIHLLKQTYPDNIFLDKAFAYTMYALTLYKNNQQTNDVVPSYLQTGGYFQEITYFFRRINKTELTCISLNQCWTIFRKYPEDKLIKQINQRLIEELISKHKLNFSDFKKSLPLQGTV
jgi:beta-barrel assembly-enhancing protease